MKELRSRWTTIPALLVCLAFLGCSEEAEDPTGPQTTAPTVVALYDGDGVWSEGLERIDALLTSWGYEVDRVDGQAIGAGGLAPEVGLLLVPGGFAGRYRSDLEGAGTAAIQSFVAGGGGFVGICAGAFLAMDQVEWFGQEIDYPLDLLSGWARGPIEEITPPGSQAWTPLDLVSGHAAAGGVEGTVQAYYLDGPELEAPGSEIFGTYADLQTTAAAAGTYGSGRVAVIGIHPEMSTATEPLLRGMVAWAMPTTASSVGRSGGSLQRAVNPAGTGSSSRSLRAAPAAAP